MKKSFIVLLLALVCSLLFASRANAEDHAYGYTGIDIDEASGVVRGYHRTEVDYNTEVYYTPSVCGSLYKDDVEQVRGCHDGLVTATVNTQTSYSPDSTYSALSDHYVRMEYEEEDPYNPGYYYFQDVLGYSFTNGGSQPVDWYYVASGIYYQRPDQSIRLGDTYVVATAVDKVQFVDVAVNDETSVTFVDGTEEGVPWKANVDVDCSGSRFKVVVKFNLPDHAASCCSPQNSRVNLFSNSKFEFTQNPVYGYSWQFFPYTSPPAAPDTSPPLAVAFVRRKADSSGSSNTLRVLVGGSYQSGDSYSTAANVHLICN